MYRNICIYKSIYTYVLNVYVANVREATYTGSLEIYRKNHTHIHILIIQPR